MKKALRIIALILVVAGVGFWAATGANRGWTKTAKASGTVDEITGIVDQTPVKTFVPGLDFLGATLLAAVVLTGASFLIRTKSNSPSNQNKA